MIEGETIQEKRENLTKIMKFGSVTDVNKREIEKELESKHLAEKKAEARKEIDYLDNNFSYEVIQDYIRDFWTKDRSLRFFINRNFKVKGKITNQIEEGIIEIPLVQKCVKTRVEDGDEVKVIKIRTFGEKIDKGYLIEDSLNNKFHLYRMVTKQEGHIQTFMIISETELELEEYEIEGMLLGLNDFSEVSKYTKILKKSHIIFANKIKSSKKDYCDHSSFMKDIEKFNLTENSFFENLLSVNLGKRKLYFQHPRYFERLVGSFFLSGKYDSSPYPLHLVIIGKQGGGKSKSMECIYENIEENVPIIEGSGSTMKSIIPSFRGELPRPGGLIEASRVSFVDEFFRILMRVDKDDRQDALTHLNPLLEHKKRRFGSGNNFIDASMTAKMFAVTNPVFGTSNMDALVQKLDNSFLSRIMVWYQDESHYKEVTNKGEDDLKEIHSTIDSQTWKAIFDYCYSFKAKFSKEAYQKIYEEGRLKLISLRPEAQGLYYSRYKHHLACLLDGLIKLRCICEKDVSFSAQKVDYANCREIWFKMIENWKKGIENVGFSVREGRFYT